MEVAVYTIIVKSYFTKRSRIELSATEVKGFQCKAIAKKSSALDIPGVADPPLITTFGTRNFSLTQTIVISFTLIAIYGRSYLYGNL